MGRVEPRLFRRKRNLWLAYGSEVVSPILKLGAKLRSRGERKPRHKWRRGLIISHTHIGDVLYRTCSLPALREYLPDCEWTYLTSPGSAEALENNPHVSEILPLVKGENSWDLMNGSFAALKARHFDVALCSNTLRHYPDLALASALGIPERFGFVGKGFSGLINNPVEMGFPDSYPAYFRRMVATAVDGPGDWPLRPRIYPGERDKTRADELWTSFKFAQGKPVVACSPRTRQPVGSWPEEVLISILEHARSQTEFEIVLCGSAADAGALQLIASRLRHPARVLAGQAGLLTFAAFLKRCTVVLTQDSGPRHIANAMGVPVLFARNYLQASIETGTYCETETDIGPPGEYLSDVETSRLASSQPVAPLARQLMEKLVAAPAGRGRETSELAER